MEHPWDRRLGFWWIAEDHPDLPAISESPDGPRTYGELSGDAHQIANLFRHLGAGPGDAVGVLADNGNTLVECSLAAQESGLYFIALNTHLTSHELRSILEHSGAKVLVIGSRFRDLVADLDTVSLGLTIVSIGEVPGLASLGAARADLPRTPPPDRQPGSLFAYTSGTTGKPKGIRRPVPVGDVGQLANDNAVFGRAFDFLPFDGPMLVSTGMFHGGSHSYYMAGLHVGHALVIMSKFEPELALQLIEKHRIRTGYMVPTQFHRFLQLPDEVRGAHDVSSLHSIVHSAAPCPRAVKERMMAWWGPVIWETYGGMEGAATIAKPHRWLERPGTVGRAIKGVQITILDDDGNELPAGEIGRIHVDNGIGFTYHDDEEQTRSAFSGKRFTLGDVGHLDADGYLFVSDRAKDMIITGGTNVYPAEVEATLLEHPAVGDAGVVGIPDDDWGETVTAIISLTDNVVPSTELQSELAAFCRERLSSFKVPRRWEFRADLPRTEAGKLYKRKMRDDYIAGSEATT